MRYALMMEAVRTSEMSIYFTETDFTNSKSQKAVVLVLSC